MKETLMAGQMVCWKAALMATPWDAPNVNMMASKMVMKMAPALDLWKDETKKASWEKRLASHLA
eukprot:1593283-Ditylum_brightwellii.AAC.1